MVIMHMDTKEYHIDLNDRLELWSFNVGIMLIAIRQPVDFRVEIYFVCWPSLVASFSFLKINFVYSLLW